MTVFILVWFLLFLIFFYRRLTKQKFTIFDYIFLLSSLVKIFWVVLRKINFYYVIKEIDNKFYVSRQSSKTFFNKASECGNNFSCIKQADYYKEVDVSPGSSVEEANQNLQSYIKTQKISNPQKFAHDYIDAKYNGIKYGTVGIVGGLGAVVNNPAIKVINSLLQTKKILVGSISGVSSYIYAEAAEQELENLREEAHKLIREEYNQ